MKKTLIAIAALVATGAFAQSSVTIGGQLDVGYVNQKVSTSATATTSENTIAGGNYGASRMWFSGSEDMGGGTKANFRLEMQPNLTDGSSEAAGIFNRGAWLGTSGSFGEIRMGRQSTSATSLVCGVIDLNGCYGSFKGAGALFGASGVNIFQTNAGQNFGVNNAATGTGTRYNRSFVYMTPNMGGFSAQIDYAFNGTGLGGVNANTSGGAGKTTALGLNYAQGALAAGFNMQRADANPTTSTATAASNTLGAKYNAGRVIVGFGYQSASDTINNSSKALSLSAKFPMGAFAPYVAMHRGSGTNSTANVTTDLYTAKVLNIGTTYALSKRTDVYADWAKDNGRTGAAGAAGYDLNASRLTVGMRHNF